MGSNYAKITQEYSGVTSMAVTPPNSLRGSTLIERTETSGGETAEQRKARILAAQTARAIYARWLLVHDDRTAGRPRRSRQCRSRRLRAMRRTLQRIGPQGRATISERLTAEAAEVYG